MSGPADRTATTTRRPGTFRRLASAESALLQSRGPETRHRGAFVNIAEFLRSIQIFDLLVVLGLFGMFILGFIQGTIRRLLGLASILFSFLVAANVRDPLGGFLASNWTHLDPNYSVMIGFMTVFIAGSIAFTIVIQAYYKNTPLFEKYQFVDELLGGALGVVQGVLLLLAMIVILDSFFEIPGIPASPNELVLLRPLHDLYDGSVTASVMRERVIPAFFFVFGAFIPSDIKQLFPRF
jgi:uncharacterized membrane protein required for colicin V production